MVLTWYIAREPSNSTAMEPLIANWVRSANRPDSISTTIMPQVTQQPQANQVVTSKNKNDKIDITL